MKGPGASGKIRVAIAGVGNCAASLVEGLAFYRQNRTDDGLLFPALCGYSVRDLEVVAAFDISEAKVGLPVQEAIYRGPNNFVRIPKLKVESPCRVLRGPTLDGNPEHLAKLVRESPLSPVDVSAMLREQKVQVLVNLLPTGSIEGTEFYAHAASRARCGFINCIPTPLAQRADFQALFSKRQLPLLGDDIKSQMGTTILHRALLALLLSRGSDLKKSTQINIGGNSDFANFVHRGETKLVSKRKSLQTLVGDAPSHVGHHFDPTQGALKSALIQLESTVFAGSTVKIEVRLQSDDKPNSAGSVVDLIRIAKGALDRGVGGALGEACAFYMKSPPQELPDHEALERLRKKWL